MRNPKHIGHFNNDRMLVNLKYEKLRNMFLCGIKLVLLSISSVICHYRSFHLRQYIGFEIVSIRVK